MEFIGDAKICDFAWGTRPMFDVNRGETCFGKPIGDKTVNYISCNRLRRLLSSPKKFDYTGWENQDVPNATPQLVERLHNQIHGGVVW